MTQCAFDLAVEETRRPHHAKQEILPSLKLEAYNLVLRNQEQNLEDAMEKVGLRRQAAYDVYKEPASL